MSSSGSGMTGVCSDGDLRGNQTTPGWSFIDANGDFFTNMSLLLTACIDNSYGGVCRRNVDAFEASFSCRYLGYGK